MYQSRSNFTTGSLIRTFTRYYEQPANRQIRDAAKKLSTELVCDSYSFPKPSQISRGGKNVFLFNDWRANILIRKVDRQIRASYGIHYPDRNQIVEQLTRLLQEQAFSELIRTDISGFFENINYAQVLNVLRNEKLLCNQTINLLSSLQCALPESLSGLPRGLPLASTMSEVLMLTIDREIRSIPGVYFYARYVDDIVLLTYGSNGVVLGTLSDCLQKRGLELNHTKTEVLDPTQGQPITVGYLGYRLSTDFAQPSQPTKVSIHEDKVKKIKTRIILSLLAFGKDLNFELLRDRLRFLADSCPVYSKGRRKGRLKRGVFFNYMLINRHEQLKELDAFKGAALYSKNNSFAKKATLKLSGPQRRELAKISFLDGFKHKRHLKLSARRMTEVVEVLK